MSFTVEMDPEKSREKSGKNYAVTPVSLTYKNKKMETYFEPLIPLSVAFTVPGTDLMIPVEQSIPLGNGFYESFLHHTTMLNTYPSHLQFPL